MTGGGTGRCLNTLEAGGLGEGWSDAVASFTQQGPVTQDFAVGKFVTTRKGGIRSAPYSTNKRVNNLMFSDVARLNDVHSVGEVWATMLHEVYASLVDQHGFSADRSNPNQQAGNIKFFQLLIDALSIQPCNPGFDDARDAILQADINRYKGENQCLISAAFAKRGLGLNARSGAFQNDNTIPANCAPVAGLNVENGNTKRNAGVSSKVGAGWMGLMMSVVMGVAVAAL
jgi:extracellular elastinolytic metalloproteinase